MQKNGSDSYTGDTWGGHEARGDATRPVGRLHDQGTLVEITGSGLPLRLLGGRRMTLGGVQAHHGRTRGAQRRGHKTLMVGRAKLIKARRHARVSLTDLSVFGCGGPCTCKTLNH